MAKTLREIAEFLDVESVGDKDIVITGVASIKDAKPGDITFVSNPKYFSFADKTRASAIIAPRNFKKGKIPLLLTDNPSAAFSKAISFIFPLEPQHPNGIHKTAVVHQTAVLGKNVSVGPHAVIEARSSVGDNCIVYPNVFIGHDTKIGKDALIYSNVTIRERCVIGERFIIHSGSVIGSDGFGYVDVDGAHKKIPQIGIVQIGDDVEIGACVTVARARFDKTIIGSGTKIDNLVQIAHNVIVGENSIIVSQSGISGSSKLGKNCVLAGQVGIVGHIEIGDNVIIAAQSGVNKSLEPNGVYLGSPARPLGLAKRIYICVGKLPGLFKDVSRIKKKLGIQEEGAIDAEDDT